MAAVAGAIIDGVAGRQVDEEGTSYIVCDVTVDMDEGDERRALTIALREELRVGRDECVTGDRVQPM